MAYCGGQHGSLLMRSQIDAYNHQMPKKTFDIKTRAVISIRQDRLNSEVRSCRPALDGPERSVEWAFLPAAELERLPRVGEVIRKLSHKH
jgi:hypothetical protein